LCIEVRAGEQSEHRSFNENALIGRQIEDDAFIARLLQLFVGTLLPCSIESAPASMAVSMLAVSMAWAATLRCNPD